MSSGNVKGGFVQMLEAMSNVGNVFQEVAKYREKTNNL